MKEHLGAFDIKEHLGGFDIKEHLELLSSKDIWGI